MKDIAELVNLEASDADYVYPMLPQDDEDIGLSEILDRVNMLVAGARSDSVDKVSTLYGIRYIVGDDLEGSLFKNDFLKLGTFSVTVDGHPHFTDRDIMRVRGLMWYGCEKHDVEAVYVVRSGRPILRNFYATDGHSKNISWKQGEKDDKKNANALAQDLADRVFYSIDSALNCQDRSRPYEKILTEMLR